MWNLGSAINNTTKKILQSQKIRAEIDINNAIEYDVKSYQVKVTVVKFTKVQLKGLKLNLPQKEMLA